MNKKHYDKNRQDPHYKIGDLVFTRAFRRAGKLEPRFEATPKTIVNVKHPTYIIKDQNDKETTIHVSDLRPLYEQLQAIYVQ